MYWRYESVGNKLTTCESTLLPPKFCKTTVFRLCNFLWAGEGKQGVLWEISAQVSDEWTSSFRIDVTVEYLWEKQ